MAAFFFDTSAIVERYIRETGSAWTVGITDPGARNDIHVSRLTLVELTPAITRLARGGSIPTSVAALAIPKAKQEFAQRFNVIEVTDRLLDSAVRIAETHGLRAYDAMQLASALEVRVVRAGLAFPALTLVSDVELNSAAIAEGLITDDPNAHP